ncbi:hypothetical protein SSS_01748 [Sarcoptes scabiei]|nr:hypothetical protein SSS_01748 [Sarcoptes scabiei]
MIFHHFDFFELIELFLKIILQRLQEHVDEVSNIMQMNIDKIMERGSNLDNLQTRSEYLANNAIEYRTITTNLQRKMWWRNMKINVIVGLIIIVILIIIIVSVTKK